MRHYIAGLPVDIFKPERNKFTAILLMTHDLWVGGWCWYDWATRLCNLGWECWAVSLQGRDLTQAIGAGQRQTPDDCVQDLRRLMGTVASPVILVGHGFGALLGLEASVDSNTIARVLLAPPIGELRGTDQNRALRLLRLKYLPLILLRQPIQIRATDFSSLWLNRVEPESQGEILQALIRESPNLVRAFFQPSTNLVFPKTRLPTLLLRGTEDQLVAAGSSQTLVEQLGGEYREYTERGHWMLHEDGWENVVNDVHRWLLKILGESILLQQPTE